jgi:hypothetical protein
MNAEDKQTILFTQLVAMFHVAAMQQMGKLKNPITDSIDRNLDAAQGSIDLLDMLQAKTRGNLNPEEERLLRSALQDLKLNYVDEASKPAPPAGATAAGEEGTPS